MGETKKASLLPRLRFPEFREEPAWDSLNGNKLFDPIDRRPAAPGLPILAITQEHGAIPRDQIDYHVSVSETSIASYKEVRPADFIISLRSFQGGIEYSKFNGICSPAYIVLKRKGDGENHFFRHLFKSDRFIQQLTRNIEGLRDGKMISYKQFSEQLLPNPSPAEQRKIAACLGSLDAWIGAESAKLEALRSHKKGLMQQLFPRPGESRPRLRFPEFHNAGEWEEKTLRSACERIMDGTHFSPKTKAGPRPYLTSKNIRPGALDLSTVTFISEEEHRSIYARCPVKKHDVLLTKDGANTGNCAINSLDYEFSLLSSVAVLRGLPNIIAQDFLYHSIASERTQTTIIDSMSGQAITRITLEKLGNYTIAIPPLAEQQRIAACLSSLDGFLSAASRKVEALTQHKKGLMQQLFPSPEGTTDA